MKIENSAKTLFSSEIIRLCHYNKADITDARDRAGKTFGYLKVWHRSGGGPPICYSVFFLSEPGF